MNDFPKVPLDSAPCAGGITRKDLLFAKYLTSGRSPAEAEALAEEELARLKLEAERKRRQHIQTRAYFLWKEAGCPQGRAGDFWLQAEREYDEAHDFRRNR